jgi:hypothetical protein
MSPPMDIYPTLDHAIYPPRADLSDAKTYQAEKKSIPPKEAKREAFMLCGMTTALNEALKYYKRQACGRDGMEAANFNELYTVHDDPTNH